MLPACVVTSEPTYQPPEDCPPYFQLSASSSITKVNTLVLKDSTVAFKDEVVLGSCATDKTFGVRPFINGEGGQVINIPPDNGSDTRTVSINLSFSTPGCYNIELIASSDYSLIAPPSIPNLPRQVAYVRFLVEVQDTSGTGHTLADCQTQR